MAAKRSRIVPESRTPFHFVASLFNWFTAFQGFNECQLILICPNQFSGAQEDLGAVSAGQMRPGAVVERTSSSGNCSVSIGCTRQRVFANLHSVRRALTAKGLAALSRYRPAVYPHRVSKMSAGK